MIVSRLPRLGTGLVAVPTPDVDDRLDRRRSPRRSRRRRRRCRGWTTVRRARLRTVDRPCRGSLPCRSPLSAPHCRTPRMSPFWRHPANAHRRTAGTERTRRRLRERWACGGRVRRRRDRGVATGTGAVRRPVRSPRDGAAPVSSFVGLGPDEGGSDGGRHLPHRVRAPSPRTTCTRPLARPWLYGIATNLVAKHRRGEARRLRAVARLAAQTSCRRPTSPTGSVSRLDAADVWPLVVEAVTALPEPERDALMLHVWEGLSYEDVADALGVPIGTVRSRLHRARERLRELAAASGREREQQHHGPPSWKDPVVSDDFDPLRRLRPDRIEPDDPGDPAVFSRAKERFMSTIDETSRDEPKSSPRPTSTRGSRTATSWPRSTTSRACSSSPRTARHAWSTTASTCAGCGSAAAS